MAGFGVSQGQLRVTEGVGGHGLPARALQTPDSHRGSIKAGVAEVLTWCVPLLPSFCPAAGTRRGLSAAIPATSLERGHRAASVAWAGVRIRPQEVVFQPWAAEVPPAASPLQGAKGSMQQASLYNEQWSLQCGMPSLKNLQMLSGHTDDVSDVTLELMGAFVYSFTPSSTESWRLQQ